MEERTKKLLIAGWAAALFVGFIFLTRWTGDDTEKVEALDGQELLELDSFCWAIAMESVPYEDLIRSAVGLSAAGGADVPQLDTPAGRNLAQSIITQFVDGLPERYSDDGQVIAEGLSRAIDGDLEPNQIDPYIAAFEDLQADAAQDCTDADTGAFDENGKPIYQNDGGYYEDNGGPFSGETTETTTVP
jgi:hypothetical protein